MQVTPRYVFWQSEETIPDLLTHLRLKFSFGVIVWFVPGHPKVNNNRIVNRPIPKNYVIWLEVSMMDVKGMASADRIQ